MRNVIERLFLFRRAVVGLQIGLSFWSAKAGQASESKVLSRNVAAFVAGLQPVGSLPDSTCLNLAISLPLRHQQALAALLQQIYDPRSPNFHRYLTPKAFAEQFGPSRQDYQVLIDFAAANHLKVTHTHPNRTLLDIGASVADIRRVLHVNMNVYQHPTEGRTFYAPDADPSVDVGIALLAIKGLDNFSLPQTNIKLTPTAPLSPPEPLAGSGTNGTYLGNDFRAAYAPGVSLDGTGQTAALVEFDGYYQADITNYEQTPTNHLRAVPLTNILVDGYSGAAGFNNKEVALDIEMLIAMAPGLSRIMVYETMLLESEDDILNQIATDDAASQISCSWIIANDGTGDQIFQQYAAQGQSFFEASGDSGAYPPGQVNGLVDNPYITIVGGTQLSTTSAGGPWSSEIVWGGTGGGYSTNYHIPIWQAGVDMSSNGGSSAFRNLPDVAMCGASVFAIYDNGTEGSVRGTSCAAPLWAGFTALVNQQAAQGGNPSLGFLNPALYAIGTGAGYATNFHDITRGSNTNANSPDAYFAVPGFDLCSGWGTPNGSNIINTLAPPDTLVMLPVPGFTASGFGGGPFSVTTESFMLTNEGTASLSWGLESDAPWLSASPTRGTLGPGASASVLVSLNAGASNLFVGNYAAHVTVTNLSNGLLHERAFTLQILDQLMPGPAGGLEFGGPPGGPFNMAAGTCELTNSSQATVNWSVVSNPPWLNVSPSSGVLGPLGSALVTCSLNAAATNLSSGAYAAGVVFNNNTFDAQANLSLFFMAGQLVLNGGFETGNFTGWTFTGDTNDSMVATGETNFVHSWNYGVELGEMGDVAYLIQPIPTVPGVAYSISLWLNSPDGLTPNEFSVSWGGDVLFDYTNLPAIGWTNLQFKVLASNTSTVLAIGSRDDQSDLGLDDVSVMAAPPTLSRIMPAAGPVAGGTTVTITGSGFQSQTKVAFGSLVATSVTFNSVANLTVVTPAYSTVGPVNVVINNANGPTAVLTNGFVFAGTPAFQTVALSADMVSFNWNATAGIAYQVQCNSSLATANWTDLGGLIIASNETANMTDSTANAQRFYRVLLVPQ
jgi:hypothetical protein